MLLNSEKKLFSEWNAETASRECVLSATLPIPQLPSVKIPRKSRLDIVNSKFKCQINHKLATIVMFSKGCSELSCGRKKLRQPISSKRPYSKIANIDKVEIVPLTIYCMLQIKVTGAIEYRAKGRTIVL